MSRSFDSVGTTTLGAASTAVLRPFAEESGSRIRSLRDPPGVGAFAVAYAIAVGVIAHRELDWKRFNEALRRSVSDIGMIVLIIMLSAMIGYVIALERVPQNAAELIVGITQNR